MNVGENAGGAAAVCFGCAHTFHAIQRKDLTGGHYTTAPLRSWKIENPLRQLLVDEHLLRLGRGRCSRLWCRNRLACWRCASGLRGMSLVVEANEVLSDIDVL
jgi:hypothetical protein